MAAFEVTVTATGLDRLWMNLANATKNVPTEQLRANQNILRNGLKLAKTLVPVDQGDLEQDLRMIEQPSLSGGSFGTDLPYSWMKEAGGTIRAVRAKYLVFKTRDGNLVFVKQVTQKGTFFMQKTRDQMEKDATREYEQMVNRLMSMI